MPINQALWNDLPPDLQRALHELRGQRGPIPPPGPDAPLQNAPPLNPEEWVQSVYQQWNDLEETERTTIMNQYGAPFPSANQNQNPGAHDWLKLFAFAAAHSVGWGSASRARAFVEWADHQNILQGMVENPLQVGETTNHAAWMMILEQQAGNPNEDHDFTFRALFAQMHRMVLKLDDYKNHLLAFNAWPPQDQLLANWIENPPAFLNLPDHIDLRALPRLQLVFGPVGCAVLLRELQRLGHLWHPGFTPYGFVPKGRLLRKLQKDDAERGLPKSDLIYQEIVKALRLENPEAVGPFMSYFDIPFQWALDR